MYASDRINHSSGYRVLNFNRRKAVKGNGNVVRVRWDPQMVPLFPFISELELKPDEKPQVITGIVNDFYWYLSWRWAWACAGAGTGTSAGVGLLGVASAIPL
ncbi:hypothetical protein QQP08_003291 [Theobroma cacao]|nr:hypothetical protein QQP08_003291 [Theobroma cacao]